MLPGEFELIARLCASFHQSRRVILGPGDDCAILSPSRLPQLLTIDSMVEGVHFKLNWGTPRMLGERSLTVNLSDIAAMGGYPAACVVNLALRDGLSTELLDGLYAGLAAAARRAGVDVVGGNITRASQLAITIALLGELKGNALRRDAARPGDEIYVTGTVGDAPAGWRILSRRLAAAGAPRKVLVLRALRPAARLAAGQALAKMRPAPAAIDISDGLLQDLGHILERSHVGAEIDTDAIPLSRAYRAVLGDDLELALTGGEDYELLFCIRPGNTERELARRLGVGVRRIGKIVRGRPSVSLKGRRATSRKWSKLPGWDQLRSPGD
jgi:thiamine-monophosphate kinase